MTKCSWVLVAIGLVGCRGVGGEDEPLAIARLAPTTVSASDGWKLFDRSVDSAFTPTEASVEVRFARSESVAGFKVYGSAPFILSLSAEGGRDLGFERIDLSRLGTGWHSFASTSPTATEAAVLRFERTDVTASAIPELELWGVEEPSAAKLDLVADALPDDFTLTKASNGADEIAAGNCASFAIDLARAPSQLRRAYVVYEARGAFRSFVLQRSLNGQIAQGGTWIDGDEGQQTFVDEVVPGALVRGTNEVKLCLPDDATRTVSVSNLRLVSELDRGIHLGRMAQVGGADAPSIVDRDPSTVLAVTAGTQVRIGLDRFISPDALELPSGAKVASVECVDGDEHVRALSFTTIAMSGRALARIEGGDARCAALSFTLAADATLDEVNVVGSGAAEPIDWSQLVVTSAREHYGELAWISGYVARPARMAGAVRVEIAGQPSTALDGSFGLALARTTDAKAEWPVDVVAHLPDGTSPTEHIVLARDATPRAPTAAAPTTGPTAPALTGAEAMFGRPRQAVVVTAPTGAPSRVQLGSRVGVEIPAGAVVTPTAVTARHLGDDDLPPLDGDMVNVTAPKGHGYEFLPHGQRFARSVEVTVPFDRTLLPEGKTVDDIRTYYFDPVAEKWKPLDRRSIDIAQNVTKSSTDHFTIMINAVLAAPNTPTPLSLDPTALTSIAAASPAAGIDLIAPPTANASGDARTGLPIRLPPGRGAFSPSLNLAYSSASGNGWVGVGWDVGVPHVEIDTRWGTPRFDDVIDRYMIDGAALVATPDTDGPSCQDGQAGTRFHTRIEGAFAHILRCGGPGGARPYHFEVHDRDGTLFIYGDIASNAVHANLASPADEAKVSRWNLARVIDVHGNTTEFHYAVDDVTDTAEPGREVYPSSISYTSHPSGLAAAYTVEFLRDNGARPDRMISGRPGFKVVTRNLLRTIRVRFQGGIVRDYVLTYAPAQAGQFGRTTLANVRMYGVGGCTAGTNAFVAPACSGEFQEHRFEYLHDEEGFEDTRNLGVDAPLDVASMPLGAGASRTTTGGLSLTLGVTSALDVTLGGSISTGSRDEFVGMYDIDGDGLPDQVYQDGPRISAVYNQAGPGPLPDNLFVARNAPLAGLLAMAHENRLAGDASLTASAFPGSVGASFSSMTTTSSRFLADVNGDGFIDYLKPGSALLGQPFADGMRFDPAAYDANTAIDPRHDPLLAGMNADLASQLILGDPVTSWTAPFHGFVHVEGTVQKQAAGSDGAIIELYQQDTLVDSLALGSTTTTSLAFPNAPQEIEVHTGDVLYVRVRTLQDQGVSGDGALLDALTAHLTVAYDQLCTLSSCTPIGDRALAKEPTGAAIYAYDSVGDFRVAGSPAFAIATSDGTLALHALFAKTPSAADIRACVQRYAAVSATFTPDLNTPCDASRPGVTNLSGTVAFGSPIADSHAFDLSIPVALGEFVVLRVESDFSFDPANVSIAPSTADLPVLAFTEVCFPDDSGTNVCSTDPDEIGQVAFPTSSFGPSIALAPRPLDPLVLAADHTLQLDPVAVGDDTIFAIRSDRQGVIAQYDCRGVSCGTVTVPDFTATAGESISFEIVGASGVPPLFGVHGDYVGGGSFSASVASRAAEAPPADPSPLVGGYRGWRSTMWNEAEPFAPTALADKYLNFASLDDDAQREVTRTAVPPVPAFPPAAIAGAPAWAGIGSIAFVSATRLDAGFLGVLSDQGTAQDAGALSAGGYARLSKTKSIDVNGSIGVAEDPFNLNLNLNAGASWTRTTTDVVDLNGDGVADVLAGDDSFLGHLGAGSAPPTPVTGFEVGDGFRRREGRDYGVGLGGGISRPVINARGRALNQEVKNQGAGVGYSHGVGYAIGRGQTTQDLMDINGDGLPDIVSRSGATVLVRLNLGDHFGAVEPFGQLAPSMLAPIDGFENLERGVPYLDSTSNALTHDTTITKHDTRSLDLIVYSRSRTTKLTASRTTRELADLNGDGLPDLLVKRDGQPLYVQYNLGGSFADPVSWSVPAWGAVISSLGPPDDPILATVGLTGPDVLAGTGSQRSSSRSDSLSIPIPGTPIKLGASYGKSNDIDGYELALIDLDGDGAPEHVLRRQTVGGTPTVYVKRNKVHGRANLLSNVYRPLGGSFTLAYTRTANSVDDPHSRQVLSRVEVDDGVDLGAGYESPNLVSTFSYAQPFFSRHEKEFFGFGTVTTTRADGGTVTEELENHSYALHGRLLRETRRDGAGRLFGDHAITYEVLPVAGPGDTSLTATSGCLQNLHPLLALDACLSVLPVVAEDDENQLEGGTASKTHRIRDLAHDRFGAVLTSIDEADDAVPSDDVYASAQYANDTSYWILGRAMSLVVRAGSASGALLRSRSGTYDAQGMPITLSVDTGTGTAVTQLGYDMFGNLNHVATPPNEAGQSQTYDVQFELITRSYPSLVTDGFGLSSSTAYDLRFAMPTVQTDTNGSQLSRTFDAFGRLATASGPYDTSQPGLSFSYYPTESPPRATSIMRAAAPADYTGTLPAPITTVTIGDGVGRAIEMRKTSTVGAVAGMTTSGLVRYDALGRTIASYYPFFTAGASTAFASPISTLATTTTYDVIDRPVSVHYPDGATEAMSYAVANAPAGALMLRTQAIDANGHARETYADVVGRTRAFVEHPTASSASVTAYDYAPTGELSQILDAEGSLTSLTYDLRGMRTAMSNPDTGLITERYDLMGNRIGLVEPNHRAAGAEVRFHYDRNRLATIDYPSKPDVTFTYGAPFATEFRAGRLIQVSDESGTQQHSYGAMGEIRHTLRSVVDPAHPTQAAKLFDFRFTTDSLGRQLRVQYPDGELVTTTYDAGGTIATVAGAGSGWTQTYVDQLRYDVFGNRTHARFGNGVITDWTFDPQRVRLTSAVTTLPTAGTRVQDLHYLYDLVGNPTSIQDTLPAPPANGKLPGTSGATFSYDGVDRLTHAVGSGLQAANKSTTYDLTFAYSASHNITQKTLVHDVINNGGHDSFPNETNYASVYTYASRPHLPSQIGGDLYTYDASGNLTRRQKVSGGSAQTYTWDDDGRLVQVSGQGANQRNVYDASGLRVLRDGQGGVTIFASPLFDLDGSKGQKHVFAGATRIATIFRNYTSTATPTSPTQAGTPYYPHPDHLGSTGAVTKDDGSLNDAHAYFPDGEAWIDSGPKDSVDGYLFNGKPFDPDTGFYDFGQRFYDPKTSLWLGVDATLADGGNLIGRPRPLAALAFAGNNPLGATDPNGRDFIWKHGDSQAPKFEFVREQYGVFAWGEDVPIVEGRAGGFRKQEEEYAKLERYRGLEAVSEIVTSMGNHDPVRAFAKFLKDLPERFARQAAHDSGDYSDVVLDENQTFDPANYQDSRVYWDVLTVMAPGALGKGGGRLNSGPLILDEELEGLTVKSPEGGKSVGALQGRQNRVDWLEVNEFDPNQPAHVRGWLQNERRRLEFGNGGTPYARTPPGYEMGHGRLTPAREGFDYSNAGLTTEELNDLEQSVRTRSGIE